MILFNSYKIQKMSNTQSSNNKRFEHWNLGSEIFLYLAPTLASLGRGPDRTLVSVGISCILFLSLLSCASHEAQANQVCLQEKCYTVEIASDESTRSKGLMFREFMPEDEGMLFIFPHLQRTPFWMKNTLIPLDIIWMDHTRRIVHVEKAAQPCTEDPCRHYRPAAEALYVLELNAGETDKSTIKVGDQMTFKLDLKSL